MDMKLTLMLITMKKGVLLFASMTITYYIRLFHWSLNFWIIGYIINHLCCCDREWIFDEWQFFQPMSAYKKFPLWIANAHSAVCLNIVQFLTTRTSTTTARPRYASSKCYWHGQHTLGSDKGRPVQCRHGYADMVILINKYLIYLLWQRMPVSSCFWRQASVGIW